jgi:hypothetical protein
VLQERPARLLHNDRLVDLRQFDVVERAEVVDRPKVARLLELREFEIKLGQRDLNSRIPKTIPQNSRERSPTTFESGRAVRPATQTPQVPGDHARNAAFDRPLPCI